MSILRLETKFACYHLGETGKDYRSKWKHHRLSCIYV